MMQHAHMDGRLRVRNLLNYCAHGSVKGACGKVKGVCGLGNSASSWEKGAQPSGKCTHTSEKSAHYL